MVERTVIKRDGSVVDFDKNKIKTAILNAFLEVDGSITQAAKIKANEITNFISSKEEDFSVEEIQNFIEEKLMASQRKDVARAFVRYRYKREVMRDENNKLMNSFADKLMGNKLENQNANVDEKSFGGRVGEASDVILKKYALENCVSKMARENHENNEIYIHDLSNYAIGNHNCLSIPIDKLLENGFTTRQVDIRPATSINTAFQLLAVVMQLQSLQQFGGVSYTHLDWSMEKYVKKSFSKHFKTGLIYILNDLEYGEDFPSELSFNDIKANREENKAVYKYAYDMTKKELYQATEGLYHNLNSLQSRSGNQLPFSSINYGTCTSEEGRLVIRALLEGSIKGTGKFGKTSIFPCGIFQCMEGVNRKQGDKNYDLFLLALESTSKRLYPNYANVDWSGNDGYDRNDPRTFFSTMGCRTANGWDVNGFGQLKDGRGNICPVTVIMPTLAMEADRDVEKFMSLLEIKINEAKDMLLERFNYIASQSPESAKFMYENGLMEGYIKEEGIISALKHGTLALGQLGLAETLQILIGCDHTEPKGMELAKRIEQLFSDKCKKYKEEYKLNFGVYFTPAENLCFTAMKKFQTKYGKIKNVSDKDFFTNSIHVPVWTEIDAFEKIDIESQLTGYSSAGCITYCESDGCVKNNPEALETLVSYAMDKDIPYFAVNVPSDTCTNCGYIDTIEDNCPHCGSDKIQRLRRVTGYLTGDYKTAFNLGKQQEVEMRVKHLDNHDLEV